MRRLTAITFAIIAFAILLAITFLVIIETEAATDTYGNDVEHLIVTDPPLLQNGVNVVQMTAPSRYLIEGEL